MSNTFVISTGRPGGAIVKAISADGRYWRKSLADGGADPAGLVSFSPAEDVAGKYDIPTTEIVGSGGNYLFTMPAGAPAGSYGFSVWQDGLETEFLNAGDVGHYDGGEFSVGFTAADRILLEMFTSGIGAASFPATTGSVFDPVAAETAVYWSYTFTAPFPLTGWTRLAFTIKRDLANDDDSDALLAMSVSNPAVGGTDGIKVHNRRPVAAGDALRLAGLLVPTLITPTTALPATLLPTALQLPPSPDSLPYAFEIDYWLGDAVKRQLGRGEFRLARSVRRGIAAP